MTNTQSVQLDISGMHCGNCVARVAKALTTAESVEVQELAIGAATVSFDPAKTSAAEIAQAVTRAGYPTSLKGGDV